MGRIKLDKTLVRVAPGPNFLLKSDQLSDSRSLGELNMVVDDYGELRIA